MAKRMLIDATHVEETRVAVVDGNRLVDFDYESIVRKQLKGSIFLAKVTRVEPSLQAAFVNFGGNRHGFLPFTEIHPDYYRIPIADREAILAEQEREMEERMKAEEEDEEEDEDREENDDADIDEIEDSIEDEDDAEAEEEDTDASGNEEEESEDDNVGNRIADDEDHEDDNVGNRVESADHDDVDGNRRRQGRGRGGRGRGRSGRGGKDRGRNNGRGRGGRMAANNRRVEVVGGDAIEGDQPIRPSLRKNYKIQEVVKRGQIMLVQVSKEERGNKGAAVSTYLSLPGRYCVLMPNSPRAGGVSRKIANFKERKRMREILNELKVPQGMSVIMRTAGVARTKTEVKRDLDYLMRLWDNIRALTLESTAPALVHEEGNLIRRSIRDIYSPDIDEVHVSGKDGFKLAKDFMKMMIPSHAKKVKEYKDEHIPMFNRYQVESQISEIGEPVVTLPSGGYLVINPTEALVSVDVNSGRATKERHIEETALKTNMEAAEEVARQLRLRDLGGLVVVDFIDMEDRRNNRKVENKMKAALSNERARIQIGRISSFGLMELSRQRLNPSLTEAQYEKCPHCLGVGVVRTIDAAAITALRALEEEGIRGRAKEVVMQLPNEVALYILNNKRAQLAEIEGRYGFQVMIRVNDELAPSRFTVEPLKSEGSGSGADKTEAKEQPQDSDSEDGSDRQNRGGRRRGRRGGRRRNNNEASARQGRDGEDEPAADKGRHTDLDEIPSGDDDKPQKGHDKKPEKNDKKSEKDVAKDDKKADKKSDKEASKKTKKTSAKKSSAKKKGADTKGVKDAGESSKSEPAPDKEKADTTKSDKKKTAAPSNDTEPRGKDYEVVNEPPSQKKKGWWNKLTD